MHQIMHTHSLNKLHDMMQSNNELTLVTKGNLRGNFKTITDHIIKVCPHVFLM